jgi:hypothetical protein
LKNAPALGPAPSPNFDAVRFVPMKKFVEQVALLPDEKLGEEAAGAPATAPTQFCGARAPRHPRL